MIWCFNQAVANRVVFEYDHPFAKYAQRFNLAYFANVGSYSNQAVAGRTLFGYDHPFPKNEHSFQSEFVF